MTAAATAIRQKGETLIARAVTRASVKQIARSTGLPERYIRSLRQGEHQPSWPAVMALAQQEPELRQAVARWLGLAPGPESAALRAEIEAVLARHPEAGDQAGGLGMAWWTAIAVVACWAAVAACWLIREGMYRDREAAAKAMRRQLRGAGSEPAVEAARKIR